MEIDNQIIYLVLKPKNLMEELSINQWNELITAYENDKDAVVEPYNPDYDGFCYITTNLHNILKKPFVIRFEIQCWL